MKTTIKLIVLLALGWNTTNAQVGIGSTHPDDNAALDIVSNDKGFLPPRMSEAERDQINNPAKGLTIYNTTEHCINFFGGFGWTSLCMDLNPGDVLNSKTGKIWMDKNLGASQVASSPTDPNAFGDLYQWGRAPDGHENRNSPVYSSVISDNQGVGNFEPLATNDWNGQFISRQAGTSLNWIDITAADGAGNNVNDLWQGVNGINNPCPAGYRVPTTAEWTNERQTWISNGQNNATGAFESIKLTLGGSRLNGGTVSNLGSQAQYWSSTVNGNGADRLNLLPNFSGYAGPADRVLGMLIRCIKN